MKVEPIKSELGGQKIISFSTLGSMYDNGCIEAVDEAGDIYRINVSEFLKVINDVTFDVEKKRVHSYLSIHTE